MSQRVRIIKIQLYTLNWKGGKDRDQANQKRWLRCKTGWIGMHNESQQRDPSFQALPLTLVCFLYYFILQKFDYAIWTGDVPPHNIWNQSRADQVKCLDGCLIVNNLSFHTHSVSFFSTTRKKWIYRPFYWYSGHIELIGVKEYYGMPRGAWAWSDILASVFTCAFGASFSLSFPKKRL